MKRKCKNVDITNLDFIEEAIKKCLKNKRKNRNDIVRIFNKYGDEHNIALRLQSEIINRKLELKPIWYKRKYDESSQKWRNIGMQDIKQQMFDYIAVCGLAELLPRIGKYQCASIKGKGQIYCVKAIYSHIQNDKIRYACKFDIRKYYESVDQTILMNWLYKHVKNEPLLWLIRELLQTFKRGLSIGSYLSQHLANLFLSDLYHNITENMYRIRHKRNGMDVRVNYVNKCFMYMDDILIIGTNSKDMMRAANVIIEETSKIGLTIKPNWRCFNIQNGFIDMCGYRIYKDHIEIRRGTLKRMRRAFIRFERNLNNVALARRVISYYGILIYSNCYKFMQKYNVQSLHSKARRLVSNENKKYGKTAHNKYQSNVGQCSMGFYLS